MRFLTDESRPQQLPYNRLAVALGPVGGTRDPLRDDRRLIGSDIQIHGLGVIVVGWRLVGGDDLPLAGSRKMRAETGGRILRFVVDSERGRENRGRSLG